jgi:hypothetical protein
MSREDEINRHIQVAGDRYNHAREAVGNAFGSIDRDEYYDLLLLHDESRLILGKRPLRNTAHAEYN